MRVRLRIPELLAAREWTPYRLSRESGGRISTSAAYRLAAAGGKLDSYSSALLDALFDVFQPQHAGELFDRTDTLPPPPKPARKRKRA